MARSEITRRAVLAAGLAAALLPGAALAINDEERAVLVEISQKLSAVKTMNGEFVQFDPNGAQRQGKFYIARPGRVRFQYDPPATASGIADGKRVTGVDKQGG